MSTRMIVALILLLNILFMLSSVDAQELPSPEMPIEAPLPPEAAPVSLKDCPETHPIKGNANSGIYHSPVGQFYDRTNPEVCFATPEAAQAAGFRASQR